ncbi:MAG: transketolase [Alphaproteobacteria bacterium]|nr:transketolase [Alphaproteobacteria bacterium]
MNDVANQAAQNPAASGAHASLANAIRALSMDAVQAANSGHPGAPMGMADMATVLFTRHLKFDATNPEWPDRDRFVLSNGHASMLLYSLLYLTGSPDMTLDEVRNFRQLGSRTPGHPEYGHAAGVETTTGPLGQGIANAVGMALAERMMNARYGDDIVDHHTYVFVGDGCLMEGISHEAISLAGHLGLSRLIVLFDDNEITIDGDTNLSVSDDQMARFAASGWDVAKCDGHDPEAIDAAMTAAKSSDKPSLIACRTVIGYGSPNKQGTSATHGAPLGDEEIAATREELGWSHEPFVVPDDVLAAWRSAGTQGQAARDDWEARRDAMPADTRQAFDAAVAGALPENLDAAVNDYKKQLSADAPKWATRKASQEALEVITPLVETMIGGSADLTGSNNTKTACMEPIQAGDYGGRYLYYGVREHGMAAAMNGMALHGGLIPYSGTFLTFTDYCRPSIRLSALMGLRVIYVMTHDSIGLGEDGPTHQPIEHVASLRAIPNVNVYRPADAVETAECWTLALQSENTPSVLALTRQGLPTVRTEHTDDNLCARGGYVLAAAHGDRAATILASGSEVEIALAAREALQAEGIPTAVVSMPCWELFDAQDDAYRRDTLGDGVRVAVEAGVTFGWSRHGVDEANVVGMRSFGASAPAGELYEHFGITADAVAERVKSALA